MEEINTIFSSFFPYWNSLPANQSPWARGKRWLAQSVLGWRQYFPTAAETPIVLQGPHPWRGDGQPRGQPVGCLQPWGPCKRQVTSNRRLPAGKPGSLKALSRLVTAFLSVSQPDVCLLVVCKWLREDWRRVCRKRKVIWVLSQACWRADRRGESKSKDKHSKFSPVGTWLQLKTF